MDVLGASKSVAQQLLERAVQANRSAYAAIKGAQQAGRMLVWGNVAGEAGKGPTPEEAVALLGTDAATWFQVSGLSAQVIALLDGAEPQIMPPGWSYVAHPDGSVTLVRPVSAQG